MHCRPLDPNQTLRGKMYDRFDHRINFGVCQRSYKNKHNRMFRIEMCYGVSVSLAINMVILIFVIDNAETGKKVVNKCVMREKCDKEWWRECSPKKMYTY